MIGRAFAHTFVHNTAMLIDDLLAYIFDGRSHLLTQPMAEWLTSSRRYTAFISTYKDKIRKKIRATQDTESLLDLQLELETAYLLLQERALSLKYEPELSERVRAPDFAVTFTTSLTFMVEVTRLRAEIEDQTRETPASNPAIPLLGMRVTDAICSKLGQLLPQRSNILLIGVEALHLKHSDLSSAMLQLQQRAEGNDSALLQRYRFRDRADFFHHYQRLSEILVRGPHLKTPESSLVWVNPQAKHPLPKKAQTALYHSHAR